MTLAGCGEKFSDYSGEQIHAGFNYVIHHTNDTCEMRGRKLKEGEGENEGENGGEIEK